MAKFKVGDKVRVLPYSEKFHYIGVCRESLERIAGNLYTITDIKIGGVTRHWYYFAETTFALAEEMLELSEQPRREFIVIRRSGAETIAELRHDREVIKSAVATCSEKDAFDFETGAKLAFDRLMGREEKPITGKSFDRIFVDDITPAPAPEPKFYTGKVFAEKTDSVSPSIKSRNGFVFEIKDGRLQISDERAFNLSLRTGASNPFRSFEEFKESHRSTTWHEVKSDV